MLTHEPTPFKAIYGPVQSWRFGQSLGIDPIGQPSTCSFNCAYCQLGDIQQQSTHRRVFVSTEQIRKELGDLDAFESIDVATLSGSGEPTLALNLREILACVQKYVPCPVVVLTNGSLLKDWAVRSALEWANQVVVKLDAVSEQQLQRINRPIAGIDLASILAGIQTFAEEYPGYLAIQTMVLKPWSPEDRARYIEILATLMPDEVQLNMPSRPRVLARRLEARENQIIGLEPYALRQLNCVNTNVLQDFAHEIETTIGIPTRYPTAKTQQPSLVRNLD
ncbi:MAG: radical SAM protein [Cyanobacteria bacterium]|nr:radical SAM protein [Cyanobacteriota bacterium]MDA0867040.1 radical SAM protein [Cyanobacteriota bacterium]